MTNSAAAVLIMDAQDRASAKIERTRGVLEKIQAKSASTALSFVSLSGAMALTGVSIGIVGNTLRNYVSGILDAQRATATMQNRLMLMGFSGDRAASTVAALKSGLTLTSSSLAGVSDEALEFAAGLDTDTNRTLTELAEKLAEARDIPLDKTFNALAAAAQGNMTPLRDLRINVDNYTEAISRVNTVHATWLKGMTSSEKASRDLSKAWGDLTKASEPLVSAGTQAGGWLLGGFADVISGKSPDLMLSVSQRMANELRGPLASIVEQSGVKEAGELIADTLGLGMTLRIAQSAPAFASTTVTMIGEGVGRIANDLVKKGGDIADHLITGLRDSLIAGLNWVIENVMNPFLRTAEDVMNAVPRLIGKSPINLGRMGLIANPAEEARRAALQAQAIREMDEAAAPFENLSPAFPSPNRGRPSSTTLNVQVGDRTLTQIVLDIIDGEVRVREPSLGLR